MERLSEYLRRWDKWTGVSKPQYRERRYLIVEREPQKQVDRLVGRVICRRDFPMGKEELRLIAAEAGMVHNIACAPEEVWFLEVEWCNFREFLRELEKGGRDLFREFRQ